MASRQICEFRGSNFLVRILCRKFLVEIVGIETVWDNVEEKREILGQTAHDFSSYWSTQERCVLNHRKE